MLPPDEPRSGEVWSLVPCRRRLDEPARLVVLDRPGSRDRWRAWPVFDAGLCVLGSDVRLPGDAAAPWGEAWCAPREALEVAPGRLGVRIDALSAPELARIRAAAAGGFGAGARRPWLDLGDPRPAARERLFAAHRLDAVGDRRSWLPVAVVASVAAVAVAGVVMSLDRTPRSRLEGPPNVQAIEPALRGKGEVIVTGELWRDGSARPLSTGARAGDVLQVRYSTRLDHLLVLTASRNGGGGATGALESVSGATESRRIVPGNGVLLPDGIALDGTDETLWFVFSARPLSVREASRRIRGGDASPDIAWRALDVRGHR